MGYYPFYLEKIIQIFSQPPESGIELYATGDTARIGERLCVEIRANGIDDIAKLQFGLLYSHSIIKIDTIENLLPDFLKIEVDFNNINVSWDLPEGGITLPDESVLVRICFNTLRTTENSRILHFVNYPVPIRALKSDGAQVFTNTSVGRLKIISQLDIALTMTDTAVSPGAMVCTRVQVAAFDRLLLGLQFSVRWDTSALQFDSLYFGQELPNLDLGRNFNLFRTDEGFITFLWIDETSQGLALTPESTFFEICFIAKDTLTETEVYFSDDPTFQIAFDSEFEELNLYGQSGRIAISNDPIMRPGDTNQDGIVNNFDLLNIGLGYGSFGPPRFIASEAWMPQPAADWEATAPVSGLNYKHFDADGNGLIELSDMNAIENNWGRMEEDGITQEIDIQPRENETPLFVQTKPILPNGQTVSFDVVLGEAGNTAENLYGLAFSVEYDESLSINNSSNSINVTFHSSWLGEVNEDLLVLQRNDADGHKIDVAFVRIDGQNRSGFGTIAQLNFTAPIFAGETPPGTDTVAILPFKITNVLAIDAEEIILPTFAMETTAVVDINTSFYDPIIAQQIKLFPNPASEILQVQSAGLKIQQIDCLDLNGRLLARYQNETQIPVQDLAAGTYWLRIITDQGVASKRFVKE